jgi:hypothetical protein
VIQVFEWAAAIFVFLGLLAAASVGVLVWALRRANRVSPHYRTAAPLSWLYSWRTFAYLHRRLRRVVAGVQAAMSPPLAVGARRREPGNRMPQAMIDLAGEIEARAVSVDDRLVVASHARHTPRRLALAELSREVRDVESSANRLVGLSNGWRNHLLVLSGNGPDAGEHLNERMDALEQALTELIPLSDPRSAGCGPGALGPGQSNVLASQQRRPA